MAEGNSEPEPQPLYIQKDVNIVSSVIEEEIIKIKLKDLPYADLQYIIAKIAIIHSEFVGELPLSVGRHPVVESTLASMKEGKGNWRHVFQNSSILYNMEKAGILKTGEARSTYVDFGTGRGQLSYVLAHVVNQETDAFLIVNKSPGNPKHDKRSKIDGGIHAPIHRVLADVVDVELGRVPLVSYETGRLVGIGKHLCGDAADVALNCLFRAHDMLESVKDVCFSFCCHHQCTWRYYVGKKFFKKCYLSERDFILMRAISSWALIESGPPQPRRDPEDMLPT